MSHMIEAPDFGPKHALGFRLHGSDYQNLRRLVRKARLNLTAINDSGSSILNIMLPYSLSWPPIYHGLLALARPSSRQTSDHLNHYQAALTALRAEMDTIQADSMNMSSYMKVLSSSYLLAIFSLSHCDGTWAQHARAMISMIRIADRSFLRSTELGQLLLAVSCHMDISAFAIGRQQRSQKAWLSWMMHESTQEFGNDNKFTTLEIVIGYPESLLTIIALISEDADDAAFEEHVVDRSIDERAASGMTQLEKSLASWVAPTMPADLPPTLNWMLRTAWESIRRAAQLFHLRRMGFYSNVLCTLPYEVESRKNSYMREIVSNIDIILQVARTTGLSIGNSLLWPLTVAGSECSSSQDAWAIKIMRLLQCLHDQFSMLHVAKVRMVLSRLWKQRESHTMINMSPLGRLPHLSLEKVARQEGLVIPLL